MCGIFGIIVDDESEITAGDFTRIHRRLFILSESRGKEASGFAFLKGNQIEVEVFKSPLPASKLIHTHQYRKTVQSFQHSTFPFAAAIGHSRLVTDGVELHNENNQPVVKGNIIGIHNGIVVNAGSLWQKFSDEARQSDLDSEMIFTLLSRFMKCGDSLKTAIYKTYREISGMSTIAAMFLQLKNLLLATDNGSLYYVRGKDSHSFVFASEYYILKKAIHSYKRNFSDTDICQLPAGTAALIAYEGLKIETFLLSQNSGESKCPTLIANEKPFQLNMELLASQALDEDTEKEMSPLVQVPQAFIAHYDHIRPQIDQLKRCTKCILPETFPFIQFDHEGVCNYCGNYKKITFKGHDQLEQVLAPFRKNSKRADCIVAFSGGRDSSYSLHYLKQELGLNPLAYSYDWGMITDLARRNQARMCGKLGVEHILVSADIYKKRRNIRKNVLAWLKRPNLGTVPLFMAGDKQYFYYANLLMKQNHIPLVILGENMLETTNFKSGFCGIEPNFNKEHTYSLSLKNKIKLALFYGKEGFFNPAYFNSSIFDTLGAFISYYFLPHHYLNIYDYIQWDEEEIETVLKENYDWEISPDTPTTWRIGDGTAPFYNYIYYTVAGFSENDTFRSNQIREGVLTREQALEKVQKENQPQFNAIRWYCNTIGINMKDALQRINEIGKLWEMENGN